MEPHEDSSYNSEADSDVECDADDPERLLDAWLGELDNLTIVSSEYFSAHFNMIWILLIKEILLFQVY